MLRAGVRTLLKITFDGDTSSYQVAYSQEAIAECEDFFNSKRAYVGTDGKFINRTDVYTVELVLRNLTSDLPPQQKLATEGYQEEAGGTFSHWGVEYDLNHVLAAAESIPYKTVLMKDVDWNVKPLEELDAGRVKNADISFPLIAIKEKNTIYVLDGNHRLRKLYDSKALTVRIKFIDEEILAAARLD